MAADGRRLAIDVIVPLYNEEAVVAEFHRQLMAVVTPLRRECDVRICYVDDGSGDGTAAELGKLRADDPAITVLTLSRNFGQQAALTAGTCNAGADPAAKIPMNCILRGMPGDYTRFSGEAQWRRTITDSLGEQWTPFAVVRGDLAQVSATDTPGVANYINTGDNTVFLLELAYDGLFRIVGVPEDMLQPLLLIQAPHMLFPFARRIVAGVVRDDGMPPLMIDPIDFAALYQTKLGQGGIKGPSVGTA